MAIGSTQPFRPAGTVSLGFRYQLGECRARRRA